MPNLRTAVWSRTAIKAAALSGQIPVQLSPPRDQLTAAEQRIIATLTARTRAATRSYLAWIRPAGLLVLLSSRVLGSDDTGDR